MITLLYPDTTTTATTITTTNTVTDVERSGVTSSRVEENINNEEDDEDFKYLTNLISEEKTRVGGEGEGGLGVALLDKGSTLVVEEEPVTYFTGVVKGEGAMEVEVNLYGGDKMCVDGVEEVVDDDEEGEGDGEGSIDIPLVGSLGSVLPTYTSNIPVDDGEITQGQ